MGALSLTPAPSLPQSSLVRDQVPYFIWTNRHGAIDCRRLRQDQVVNHYARVGAFTTKVGAWSPWGGGEMTQQGWGESSGGCHPSLNRRGCASTCETCPGSTKLTPTPSSPGATGWGPWTSGKPSSVSSGLV